MTTSTLFIQNITQIDLAYLNISTYIPTGDSYNLSALVSGEIDELEQVVVDFSNLKKTIKMLVDDKVNGFDHKFWLPESAVEFITIDKNETQVSVETPHFHSVSPLNAIRFVDKNNIIESITNYLKTELNIIYPNTNINITIKLNNSPMVFPHINEFCFRYVHGLKNSSSWGCQNMNHGHLSWLLFFNKNNKQVILNNLTKKLSTTLNTIFIWEENIVSDFNNTIQIAYNTERGHFYSSYKKELCTIISKETTVENLAEWFSRLFYKDLIKEDVKTIWFSEGLVKGSVFTL
jgi:hypothetical protein